MAESNTSVTETSEGSSAVLSIPSQLKFVMANIRSIVSIQLTTENYPLWSSQVLKLIKANGYESFLTGGSICPPESQLSANGLPTPNPNYLQWQLVDQDLFAALSATISPSILPYVLSLTTTAAMWDTLVKQLQATNRSRVIQLKNELHHISLKNNTITQYLSEVKALVDQIAAAGSPVDNEDVILYILNEDVDEAHMAAADKSAEGVDDPILFLNHKQKSDLPLPPKVTAPQVLPPVVTEPLPAAKYATKLAI